MNEAELFGQHCRMTCLGGSEAGTCSCAGPQQCALKGHPKYSFWREKAVTRLARFLVQGLREGKQR